MKAKKFVQLVLVSIVLAACVSSSIPRVSANELKVGGGGQYSTISAAVKHYTCEPWDVRRKRRGKQAFKDSFHERSPSDGCKSFRREQGRLSAWQH
jgi:hypothetical protein